MTGHYFDEARDDDLSRIHDIDIKTLREMLAACCQITSTANIAQNLRVCKNAL
jgi:hypothetical protein